MTVAGIFPIGDTGSTWNWAENDEVVGSTRGTDTLGRPAGGGLAAVALAALAGPVLFLLTAIGATIWVVSRGARPESAAEAAAALVPHIMVSALGALFVMTVLLHRPPQLRAAWKTDALVGDLASGGLTGLALGVAYLLLISPWHVWLQQNLGDYVRAGETTAAISSAPALFLVANLGLAPFAEETLYRGFLIDRLRGRLGLAGAVAASCAAFGLLHWLGGFWYMVITGLVAGGAFATLRLWRGSLVAPFAAHFAMNAVEFVWLAVGSERVVHGR